MFHFISIVIELIYKTIMAIFSILYSIISIYPRGCNPEQSFYFNFKRCIVVCVCEGGKANLQVLGQNLWVWYNIPGFETKSLGPLTNPWVQNPNQTIQT